MAMSRIMGCAYTHGFLPKYMINISAVVPQIAIKTNHNNPPLIGER